MLEHVPDVTYDDIGGLGEQVEAIRDAVELPYLHADLFVEHELRPPKGILLYGPPGCGKTMIAKAVANSLAQRVREKTGRDDVKSFFLNVKGPELLNKYVGETERPAHVEPVGRRHRVHLGLAGADLPAPARDLEHQLDLPLLRRAPLREPRRVGQQLAPVDHLVR